MIMPLVRGLLIYRLPMVLVTTAVSFLGLLRGLLASSVLSETVWPSLLREQALVLAVVSAVIATALLFLIRRREQRFLPSLAVLTVVTLMAAFGFASVAAAVAVIACCSAAGHAIERIFGGKELALVDTTVVGLSALMLLLALVGALQLHMVPVLWAILFTSAIYAVCAPLFRARLAAEVAALLSISSLRLPSWLTAVPLALGIFAILFFTAQTALPERYADALAMHFLVPEQILAFGRWNLDPAQYAFAVMPVTVNYIYTFAYLLGGEMATRLFNLFVLFGVLAQIASMVRPLYGRSAAGLAVLLFLAIPTALIVTASLFIENTVALLTVTAVRLLLQQNSESYRSALVGLVIALGALCAAKLHGVILSLPIIVLALFGQNYRRLSRSDWRTMLILAAVCILLGAMPYLLAWVKTGNPIFPLQNAFFKSPYWPPVNFEDRRWMGHWSPLLIYRMTFMSTQYFEAYPGAMGFAFVALLLPGVIACLFRPRREIMVCLMVAGFFTLVVTSQSQYIRYLYPVFPLMVVICIAAVAQVAAVKLLRRPAYAATVLLAALGIYKLPSGGWILQNADLSATFSPGQKVSLIRAQVPHRTVNAALSALVDRPRVIYVTVAAYGAFLAGTPIYVEWYNMSLLTALAQAKNADDIKLVIDRQKADFIVTDAAINPAHYLAAHQTKVVAYAQAHADHIASIGGLSIFRVRRQ
jgi:hypothetical protein